MFGVHELHVPLSSAPKLFLSSSSALHAKPSGFTDMFHAFTSSLSTNKMMILHLQRFRRTHNHTPKDSCEEPARHKIITRLCFSYAEA